MDFTSTYSYASWDSVVFSPGSTFLAYVSGRSRTQVFVRVVGTLQVVRSWQLDACLDALEWSKDGLYLLASAYGLEKGVSFVLPLDPDVAVTDGSDDDRGWVARISAVHGLLYATWLPLRRIPAVIQFAPFHTGAVIYSLADQALTVLPATVLPCVFSHAMWPEHFATVQRHKEQDYLCLYTPHQTNAPSLEQPVEWDLWRAVRLHTNEISGAAWSPDGSIFAVWEHMLEYKLFAYTIFGTPQAAVTMQEDLIPHVAVPISAAECRATLTSPTDSGRARRVPVFSSTTSASRVSSMSTSLTKHRSSYSGDPKHLKTHGLGVRVVAWHPSSEFLAVGAYDDHVHILSRYDWSLVYLLDTNVASLRNASPASLSVWQEPYRWFEATSGRGIVPLNFSTTIPVDVPLQPSLAHEPLQSGTCWMAWNQDGSLLALRNEHTPSVVLLYEFVGIEERSVDAHIRAIAVIILSSPITSIMWRFGHLSSLALVTGQSSVICWTMNMSDHTQCCEAVAIPNEHFSATHITCSPDGKTMLLADAHTFCCVVSAPNYDGNDDDLNEQRKTEVSQEATDNSDKMNLGSY